MWKTRGNTRRTNCEEHLNAKTPAQQQQQQQQQQPTHSKQTPVMPSLSELIGSGGGGSDNHATNGAGYIVIDEDGDEVMVGGREDRRNAGRTGCGSTTI